MPLCNSPQNRRDFLKTTVAASSAVAAMSIPRFAHAGVNETLKYGLIGCGKRGSGAAVDAMNADPQAKLVAIGDTFTDSAKNSLESIKRNAPNKEQVAMDADHIFSCFDAYKRSSTPASTLSSSQHRRTSARSISSMRLKKASTPSSKSPSRRTSLAFTKSPPPAKKQRRRI
jgi:hypothetical protein